MNFSIEELTRSDTALRLGIDNTPSEDVVENLNKLINSVLQPIRDNWKAPIIVNSGYRCKRLNKAVGGVPTSQHLSGEAADIRALPNLNCSQKTINKALFELIEKLVNDKIITVGQLLDENNFSWIHVSIPNNKHLNDIKHL